MFNLNYFKIMKKNNFTTIIDGNGNESVIFTKEDILNERMTPTKRYHLTEKSALIYTLVYEMFKFMGDMRDVHEIMDECFHTENWFTNHEWTYAQSKEFQEKVIVPIIRKTWGMNKTRAEHEAGWWMLSYGFKYSDPDKIMLKD